MYYDLGGRASVLGGKSTMNLKLSLAVFLTLNALQSPSSAIRSTNMSDREKAGLRGPVRTCTEETIYPGGKSLTTSEYSIDGRVLTIRTTQPDGSEWVSANIYDTNGHLVKTVSGKLGELGTEMRSDYDDTGRLLTTTNSSETGNRTNFHYDEQGRKTAVQHFDTRALQRAQSSMYSGSPWEAAVGAGIGVPVGGHITTIYDGNDQPTEAQIRDAEDRLVSRIVRTYDANGRLVEEEPIQENPALFFADRFGAEGQPQLTAAQLEAMNTAMKSLLRGRSGTGTSYIYDEQGRITKIHDRNFMFDKVTIIAYNERGDKSEERTTIAGNSTVPVGVAFSVEENGTLIPDKRATEPTESPDLAGENEVQYAYQYDSYGNWTQQTANHSSGRVESSSVRLCNRKLTYY
ncbi:MAG: hypothetical protein DMG43_05910 [Acidobacteria bacterium]|nr:MAG: hypothetical protein DMG43_05910 [Acidobacteriota bacterium]